MAAPLHVYKREMAVNLKRAGFFVEDSALDLMCRILHDDAIKQESSKRQQKKAKKEGR